MSIWDILTAAFWVVLGAVLGAAISWWQTQSNRKQERLDRMRTVAKQLAIDIWLTAQRAKIIPDDPLKLSDPTRDLREVRGTLEGANKLGVIFELPQTVLTPSNTFSGKVNRLNAAIASAKARAEAIMMARFSKNPDHWGWEAGDAVDLEFATAYREVISGRNELEPAAVAAVNFICQYLGIEWDVKDPRLE